MAKTNKSTKRFMKKTTKKGAYKKATKQQTANRRRPFVETKTRVLSDVAYLNSDLNGNYSTAYPDRLQFRDIPVDDAFTFSILPETFTRMNTGLTDNDMIGDDIYSRYVKSKFTFKFLLVTT